jgi:sterol desaturase/sphingolipid hydroxylase (fatty acid hydroxylase superfamily)
VQDLLYLVLYATAVVPLVLLINVGVDRMLVEVAPWLTVPRLAAVPTVAMLVVAVLLMDFCNWLAHWANHRWTPVWRFHAVHHSQEELSVLTSFRAHPLVHTSFLISVVPVFILSSNATLPATVVTVYICLSSLPHANLRWTFGLLGRWMVSPAYHRIHHATEGRIDVNLGTVFTFWDVLTRRAVFPVRGAEPIATGLGGRPVPVEQAGGSGGWLGVLGVQLVEPFAQTSPTVRVAPAWAGPSERTAPPSAHPPSPTERQSTP